jgi:hypothetical protein
MTTKFARNKHAFRTPDVCKKKTPGPEEEEEGFYPQKFVWFWYDIDVTWAFFHYQFTGTNKLQVEDIPWGLSWRWMDTPDPPYNGAWCRFQHTWISGGWNANLWYLVDGLTRLNSLQTGVIELEPLEIDTGIFQLDFGPLWTGKKDARVHSDDPG